MHAHSFGECYSIIIIYYCRGYLLLLSSSSSSMPSEWCRLLTSIVSGQYPPISPICPRPTPAPPHCTFCYSDILMKIFLHPCRLLIVLVQGSPFRLSSIDDQRNLQNVGNAKNCNLKIPEILLALPSCVAAELLICCKWNPFVNSSQWFDFTHNPSLMAMCQKLGGAVQYDVHKK